DPIPRQFLSTLNVRDVTVNNFLTALIKNPFQGLAPGTNLNGSTVQRQQLLRPFPQFTRIRWRRDDCWSRYDSAQLSVERRFPNGYTVNVAYTFSKALERRTFLNATDADYEKRLADFDITHRFVINGIWELPFGRGQAWGKEWNGVVNAFLGGWTV